MKNESVRSLRPIEKLRREMDRLFDDMLPVKWVGMVDNEIDQWTPKTDMSETDDEYIIDLDLPGIPKENIEITYRDNQLTIKGENNRENEEKKENYLRKERYSGQFVRSFTLPVSVKDDKIKANFKNGVLNVKVPKAEVKKPKKVNID